MANECDFFLWLFNRVPGFLANCCLSLVVRIATDFHSHILFGLVFLAQVLWAGDPTMGLRTLALKEGSLQLRDPSRLLSATYWVWGQPFSHLSPSYQSLLQILDYKAYLPLVFSGFFRMIVL